VASSHPLQSPKLVPKCHFFVLIFFCLPSLPSSSKLKFSTLFCLSRGSTQKSAVIFPPALLRSGQLNPTRRSLSLPTPGFYPRKVLLSCCGPRSARLSPLPEADDAADASVLHASRSRYTWIDSSGRKTDAGDTKEKKSYT